MGILDLPQELVDHTLYYCIVSRSTKKHTADRVLRLKLVCKLFYNSLEPVLFETKVLDKIRFKRHARRPVSMEGWRVRSNYGAPRFWHSYLTYRTQQETNPGVGYYTSLKKVTEIVSDVLSHVDKKIILDTVCWLSLDIATARYIDGPREFRGSMNYLALCVVAYLGEFELAKKFVEANEPTTGLNPEPFPSHWIVLHLANMLTLFAYSAKFDHRAE
ncbi:hypothetical protein BX600DRAFT_474973 [Xylariales sp. PMI_506]|nr:hypothetical protein BX600DRAFT_474973 [Xylariales sp. PMI_506]